MTAIVLVTTTVTAGCAERSGGGTGSPPVGADSSASMSTTPCQQIDLRAIRSMTDSRVPVSDVPKADAEWVMSKDALSFIAKITAADLTSAGINTSDLAQSTPLLLFVNHGAWDSSSLPIGGGPGAGAATGSASSTPEPAVDNWTLFAVDPTSDQLALWVASPDDPCFVGS